MSYKIYSLQKPPFGFVQAVIITTSYKNPGGYLKAEYFLIYLEQEDKVVSENITILKADRASGFETDLDSNFMFERALEAALEKLVSDDSDSQKMNLKESDITLIEALCLKRRGNKLFRSLEWMTEHSELAEKLCSIAGTEAKLKYTANEFS